jgi:putative NIF3 family GTP cyclohydrolase 1 type 2
MDLRLSSTKHSRSPIKALETSSVPGAGMGRIVRFDEPQPLNMLIERIARGVGNPKGFPIAIPQGKEIRDITIRSVAICAGSGGSLFSGLKDIDLLFTGELSHHEALAAIEKGQCVITLFHSNTERGFLHSVLRNQLLDAATKEWTKLRNEGNTKELGAEGAEEALNDDSLVIDVSERDRDPYGVLISKDET